MDGIENTTKEGCRCGLRNNFIAVFKEVIAWGLVLVLSV